MKLITAVVTPSEFEQVHKALDTFGVAGLTITEVFQRDLTGGRDQIYRGPAIPCRSHPACPPRRHRPDHDTTDLVHILTKLTSPRERAQRIWITPVEVLTRIRTGERGTEAL
ncbi:MAG: P-II family nitrogen regulator [Pseudonocardiaceae bacterium]